MPSGHNVWTVDVTQLGCKTETESIKKKLSLTKYINDWWLVNWIKKMLEWVEDLKSLFYHFLSFN